MVSMLGHLKLGFYRGGERRLMAGSLDMGFCGGWGGGSVMGNGEGRREISLGEG